MAGQPGEPRALERGLSRSVGLLGLADAASRPQGQVSACVSIPAFGEPAGDTPVTAISVKTMAGWGVDALEE